MTNNQFFENTYVKPLKFFKNFFLKYSIALILFQNKDFDLLIFFTKKIELIKEKIWTKVTGLHVKNLSLTWRFFTFLYRG